MQQRSEPEAHEPPQQQHQQSIEGDEKLNDKCADKREGSLGLGNNESPRRRGGSDPLAYDFSIKAVVEVESPRMIPAVAAPRRPHGESRLSQDSALLASDIRDEDVGFEFRSAWSMPEITADQIFFNGRIKPVYLGSGMTHQDQLKEFTRPQWIGDGPSPKPPKLPLASDYCNSRKKPVAAADCEEELATMLPPSSPKTMTPVDCNSRKELAAAAGCEEEPATMLPPSSPRTMMPVYCNSGKELVAAADCEEALATSMPPPSSPRTMAPVDCNSRKELVAAADCEVALATMPPPSPPTTMTPVSAAVVNTNHATRKPRVLTASMPSMRTLVQSDSDADTGKERLTATADIPTTSTTAGSGSARITGKTTTPTSRKDKDKDKVPANGTFCLWSPGSCGGGGGQRKPMAVTGVRSFRSTWGLLVSRAGKLKKAAGGPSTADPGPGVWKPKHASSEAEKEEWAYM